MDFPAKWEVLKAIHGRYRKATRKEKGVILTEFCQVTGYHRKYAPRRFNGPPPGAEPPRRRRRGICPAKAVQLAVRPGVRR